MCIYRISYVLLGILNLNVYLPRVFYAIVMDLRNPFHILNHESSIWLSNFFFNYNLISVCMKWKHIFHLCVLKQEAINLGRVISSVWVNILSLDAGSKYTVNVSKVLVLQNLKSLLASPSSYVTVEIGWNRQWVTL